MIIDEKCYSYSYGKEALRKCLEYITTKPFGNSSRVALTCSEQNTKDIRLYESPGFRPAGNRDEDEIEMALSL